MKRKVIKADQWVKKAIAKGKSGASRMVLADVHQVDGCTIAADGYRLHAVGPIPAQADGELNAIISVANLTAPHRAPHGRHV